MRQTGFQIVACETRGAGAVIIKSSRIPSSRTRVIARYLAAEADNESIRWRRGSADDVETLGRMAVATGRSFGVRHIVIAPTIDLVGHQLIETLRTIQGEYRVSDIALSQCCIVEHTKLRAGQGKAGLHFHLALPELDLLTGKVMDSRFTRIRDEKISRLLELKFGHPSTPGRFSTQVLGALHCEFPELDLTPLRLAVRARGSLGGTPDGPWLSRLDNESPVPVIANTTDRILFSAI